MIAVIDYGCQYTQLVARRIREQNVFSEIFHHSITFDELQNVDGIILSGGPSSTYEDNAPQIDKAILQSNIPILGICYGMQLMLHNANGEVVKGQGEYGLAEMYKTNASPLLEFLVYDIPTIVWMSHGDEVTNVGHGFEVIARSGNGPIAAVQHKNKPHYGVQFHPEVIHTKDGKTFIQNFLFRIADCKKDWTPSNIISDSIKSIKEKVGNKKVITGISGGIDSTVVGTLLNKAIGNQSKCAFINTGLLRKDEPEQIMSSMQALGLNIREYNFTYKFLGKLKNITEPEEKRKIIGKQFIRCFESIGKDAEFLAQGTLYPDVVESGTDTAATIKSHHNVGGLPDDMQFKLIEPLRNLFKDEVRILGKELGLPDAILNRQPFPGPGLAVRILGEITHDRLRMLREADYIFLDTLGEQEGVWQAFAILIPVKTVGVMGDIRTYENIIALRVVSSEDGMTADFYNVPYETLKQCSTKIINNVVGVNRVVYDITSKPPGTIEWI